MQLLPVLSETLRAAGYSCGVESPASYPLVDRFYRQSGYKVKATTNELILSIRQSAAPSASSPVSRGSDEDEFLARGVLVGAVRLLPQPSGHFWLRNLLVASDHRGRGLAKALLAGVLSSLGDRGCYCFALPHLEAFYQEAGFQGNPAHCPMDIRAKYQQYRSRGRDWLLMGYIRQNTCPTTSMTDA